MELREKTARTCKNGHKYYKSTDCPTCPVCEGLRKPKDSFISSLVAPARRALESKGIQTPAQLAKFTEAEIMALHGMGAGSLPKLRAALEASSLTFKEKSNDEKS